MLLKYQINTQEIQILQDSAIEEDATSNPIRYLETANLYISLTHKIQFLSGLLSF